MIFIFSLEKINTGMTAHSVESLSQVHGFNLEALNQKFEVAHPLEILSWCIHNIPTGLVQTSAFNVDDMVITDMLYRQLSTAIPVLFLNTLHHFPETLVLVEQVQTAYTLNLAVYKIPEIATRAEFAARFGDALWEKDIKQFHHLTKIEPLQRGLNELNTVAWITGRRRDQATTRGLMPIVELDNQQRLKINPLANWTRPQSWAYAMEHGVLYNPLHDQGYPSIGDEPLTTKVAEGEDERAGRWRGLGKTECGIHMED